MLAPLADGQTGCLVPDCADPVVGAFGAHRLFPEQALPYSPPPLDSAEDGRARPDDVPEPSAQEAMLLLWRVLEIPGQQESKAAMAPALGVEEACAYPWS